MNTLPELYLSNATVNLPGIHVTNAPYPVVDIGFGAIRVEKGGPQGTSVNIGGVCRKGQCRSSGAATDSPLTGLLTWIQQLLDRIFS